MAYEHKNGQGTAFKNDKYEKGGNQPYARGQVKTPEGKLYDVTLWTPKSDKVNGFNVTLQEPYQKDTTQREAPVKKESQSEDLPF